MLSRSEVRIGRWQAGTQLGAHSPGVLQLLVVMRGQLSWMASARPGLLRAGWARLVWVPAPACESRTQNLVADSECEVIVVTVPARDLAELAAEGAELLAVQDVLSQCLERQQPLDWEDRAWLGGVIAHDLPCRARDLWTRLRLAELLLRILLPEESSLGASPPQDDKIARAQAWIEARLDETLDQEALAAHLGCSTRTLRRWLREELDLAPAQWQRLLRLQRAATLLREGRGAAEAGLEVGYPNAAHFSNLFKLHYQCPPSQYRQRGLRAG